MGLERELRNVRIGEGTRKKKQISSKIDIFPSRYPPRTLSGTWQDYIEDMCLQLLYFGIWDNILIFFYKATEKLQSLKIHSRVTVGK